MSNYITNRCVVGGASALATLAVGAGLVRGQIVNWQTKQVIPGTEGVSAGPGVNLSGWNTTTHNLRYADLRGSDLSADIFSWSWMDGATFAGSTLVGARFDGASVAGADFTGAVVAAGDDGIWAGISFWGVSGLTAAQLYSTASYGAGNLRRIALANEDLRGWNFAGQNLQSAQFHNSDMSSAVLTGADLGAAGLFDAKLMGAKLGGANLSGAQLAGADLGGADFTDAVLVKAIGSATNLGSTNLTAAQLYSTASYRAKNLQWVSFYVDDLAGWDFRGQDLFGASFRNASMVGTTLTGADLNTTDFSLSDLRGAIGLGAGSSAVLDNAILPDGTVDGLDVTNDFLVVRNYPVGVRVRRAMTLSGSELRFVLSGEAWGSTVAVDPDVTPDLAGGTLNLTFAFGVDPHDMVGRTFDLFDWSQPVVADRQFGRVMEDLPEELYWDLSDLYVGGTARLVPEPMVLGVSAVLLPLRRGRRLRA